MEQNKDPTSYFRNTYYSRNFAIEEDQTTASKEEEVKVISEMNLRKK